MPSPLNFGSESYRFHPTDLTAPPSSLSEILHHEVDRDYPIAS